MSSQANAVSAQFSKEFRFYSLENSALKLRGKLTSHFYFIQKRGHKGHANRAGYGLWSACPTCCQLFSQTLTRHCIIFSSHRHNQNLPGHYVIKFRSTIYTLIRRKSSLILFDPRLMPFNGSFLNFKTSTIPDNSILHVRQITQVSHQP